MNENSNYTNNSFNLDNNKRRLDTDSMILNTEKSYFNVEVGNYVFSDSIRENTKSMFLNENNENEEKEKSFIIKEEVETEKNNFNQKSKLYNQHEVDEEEVSTSKKQNLINTSKYITPDNNLNKSSSNSQSNRSSMDEKDQNFTELADNLNLNTLNRQETQTDQYFLTNRTYNDFRRINKVLLARTKDTPNDKFFKHEIYIEGDIEMTSFREDPVASQRSSIKENRPYMFINLNKFSNDSLLFTRRESKFDFFGFGTLKLRKEDALRYSCEFFSKLMESTSAMLENFKIYYKNVNLQSLMIFCLFEVINSGSNAKFKLNFQNEEFLENNIINLIKSITIDQIVNLIPKYIEYLTSSFNKHSTNGEDSIFDNLVIDKSKFAELGKYHIYSDVTNVINKFLNFFLLKWREKTIEDIISDHDHDVNNQFPELQSNYFYLLLIKIQHYIKHYFPLCCGTKNVDEIIYNKSPFAFCYDCKLILCINCFKYHKLHEYFDFANFNKNKDKTIQTEKERFLNYQDSEMKKKTKLRESQEDLIMTSILDKFESRVYSLFNKGKDDSFILKKKKFMTVFDFFEILLLEHLYKLVFPFIVGNKEGDNPGAFIGKEEFRNTKEKMAKDEELIKAITKAFVIAHSNSNNNINNNPNSNINNSPGVNAFITPKNATSNRAITFTSNDPNATPGNYINNIANSNQSNNVNNYANNTPYTNLNNQHNINSNINPILTPYNNTASTLKNATGSNYFNPMSSLPLLNTNNSNTNILNEYYTTAINLYTEAKTKRSKDVKKNRYIIEDLFYNTLSNEFGVGKALLESNVELNYEAPGDSFAHFISQPNSPKQFYSDHIETTIRKFHFKKALEENVNNLNNLNTHTSTGFAGKTQFNKFLLEIAQLNHSGTDLNTPVISKKIPNSILSNEKLISPFKKRLSQSGRKIKNFSNKMQEESYSLNEIIPKALNLDKDLNNIFKSDSTREILIKEKGYDRKDGLMRFRYKDGYCSKYDMICLYVEDLLEKINNYGQIKYKYKL
jgi:hypothetical protein